MADLTDELSFRRVSSEFFFSSCALLTDRKLGQLRGSLVKANTVGANVQVPD